MRKPLSLLIILILIPFAFAIDESINIENSYDFLRHQEPTTVFEMSWAALALNNADTASAQPIISWIKDQQDSALGCFPTGDCTIKDTALAIIVLNQEGWDVTDAKDWLLSQQKTNTQGGIYLQVITQEQGTCNIEYTQENAQVPATKELAIDKGLISSTACPTKTTFFNIGNCLESNLFGKNPSLQAKVLCRDLGDAKISLVYVDANSYYLVYSSLSNTIEDLTLNMGYFTNYEDTLYANWALSSIGSGINSITWLKKQFSPGNVRDNSLIYAITEQEPYIHNLLTLQNKNTGSFNSAFETGLACLAFTKYGTYGEEVEQARKWLNSRQLTDGSWNNNILDTAATLYGCYSTEAVNLQPCIDETCYPKITTAITQQTEPEPITCTSDLDCDIGETCDTFIGQCVPEQDICNNDYECQPAFGEDEYNCPSDCAAAQTTLTSTQAYCGDKICGFGEDYESCPQDCEETKEKSGFFWIIVIILLLALFLGAVYYFLIMKPGKSLTGMFKKKRKEPIRPVIRTPSSYRRPARRSYIPPPKQRKSMIETELEKSLSEAKKLLKK